MVTIVVAMAENRVIGKDNQLIWHLPADLKHFKALTINKPIIMGRKTFESIGKPLPQRTSIIVTHQQDYKQEGALVVHSLEEAIRKAREISKDICIIGGATIYQQALPFTDVIELTKVHHTFEGDTFFPEINPAEWQETERMDFEGDEKNMYPYSFIKMVRKA